MFLTVPISTGALGREGIVLFYSFDVLTRPLPVIATSCSPKSYLPAYYSQNWYSYLFSGEKHVNGSVSL